MNLKPRNHYILVELLPREEETTKSGITIPEQAMRYQQPLGLVHEVGPAIASQNLKVGMKVILSNGGFKHSYLGKDFVLIAESEVLAVLE